MGIFANFKIRTTVLVVLLPLAMKVLAAAMFASNEMHDIDRWYSELIERDIRALQNGTEAQALNTQFGQLVYKEIAEPDRSRMQVVDAEIENTVAEFHSALQKADEANPKAAADITEIQEMFNRAAFDSRPVRAVFQHCFAKAGRLHSHPVSEHFKE